MGFHNLDSQVSVDFGTADTSTSQIPMELAAFGSNNLPLEQANDAAGSIRSGQDAVYVRLYIEMYYEFSTNVIAVTGDVVYATSDFDTVETDLTTFTPTEYEITLPPGAFEVSVEVVGRAYNAQGLDIFASFNYNPVTKKVTCNEKAFASAIIRYYRWYGLYTYSFGIGVGDYLEGVVSAICMVEGKTGLANLTIPAPVPPVGGQDSYNYNDNINIIGPKWENWEMSDQQKAYRNEMEAAEVADTEAAGRGNYGVESQPSRSGAALDTGSPTKLVRNPDGTIHAEGISREKGPDGKLSLRGVKRKIEVVPRFFYWQEYYRVVATLYATESGLFRELPDNTTSYAELAVVYRICYVDNSGRVRIDDLRNPPSKDKNGNLGGAVNINGRAWYNEYPGAGSAPLNCVTVYSAGMAEKPNLSQLAGESHSAAVAASSMIV